MLDHAADFSVDTHFGPPKTIDYLEGTSFCTTTTSFCTTTPGRHHLGDHGKLTEVVQATEQAIVIHAQELLNSSDHHEERGEMAVATESLLAIKAHKLGWPSVPSSGGLH
jgi:hypothetical protein